MWSCLVRAIVDFDYFDCPPQSGGGKFDRHSLPPNGVGSIAEITMTLVRDPRPGGFGS
jgi:hypothetical protein